MQELRRTDPVSGPEEIHSRLREDGYVFLPGLLPAEDVMAVRAEVIEALRVEHWIAVGTDPGDLIPGPRACLEGAPGYFGAYRRLMGLQSLNELAHHPAVVALFEPVVGAPLLVHPRKIARASQPHTSEYTPPHQDYRLVQGTPDTLTMWLPLGDCPVELGGLRVLAGSHQQGLLPVRAAQGPGGLATVGVDEDDPQWCSSDYRASDVIVFHSLTVHGALPNDTDGMRLSADFRYQSALLPVATPSLQPHFANNPLAQMPRWDELTERWTSTSSISTPPGVIEVEMGDLWADDLPIAESALC